jgi:hypothetical protein
MREQFVKAAAEVAMSRWTGVARLIRVAQGASCVALGLLLAGCGGGGSGANSDSSADTPVVTKPADNTLPAASLSLVPAKAQTDSGKLVVIEDFTGEHVGGAKSTTLRADLAVFDTQARQLVWRQPMSIFTGPYDPITPLGPSLVSWLVLDNVRHDPGRLSKTYLGAGSLYYISDSHLYRRDLTAGSQGAPQLVSNRLVCYLRPNPMPLQDDGSRALLTVFVPPDNKDCTVTSLSYEYAMVDTGTDRWFSGFLLGPVREPLMVLTDPDGGARGILSVDRSSGRNLSLLVHSVDLSSKLATLATDVSASQSTQVVVLPGQLVDVRMRLLRVGQQVRLLDWRSGRIALSAPLFSVSTASVYDAIAADADATTAYIGDACLLRAVDSTGQVRTLATLAPADGYINRVQDAGSRLLIDTDGIPRSGSANCPLGGSGQSAKRFAVDKLTGQKQEVEAGEILALVNNEYLVLDEVVDGLLPSRSTACRSR